MFIIKQDDFEFGKRVFIDSESVQAQKEILDIINSQKNWAYSEFYKKIFNFLKWTIKKDNEYLTNDKIYQQQDETRIFLLFFIGVFYSANNKKLLAIETSRIKKTIDKNVNKSFEEVLGGVKKRLISLNNDLGVFSEFLFSSLTISKRSFYALLVVLFIFLDVIDDMNKIENEAQIIWQNWKNKNP